MPLSHPKFLSFDPPGMNKLLTSQAVVLPETKNQQERTFDETCWVHICIRKKTKNRKSKDEEGGEKQKKQDS